MCFVCVCDARACTIVSLYFFDSADRKMTLDRVLRVKFGFAARFLINARVYFVDGEYYMVD